MLRNNICVADCEDGEYVATRRGVKRCMSCHSSCKTCTGLYESSCLECENDMEKPDRADGGTCICNYYLRDGICVTQCEEREYVESRAGQVP